MSAPLSLLIKADATAAIGAGHAMRMSVLAAAWRRAELGGVRWSGTIAIPFVAQRLELLGIRVESPEAYPDDGEILAVDSYDLDRRRGGARAANASVRILVDDGAGPVFPGYDLVWWPAPFGDRQQYSRHDCDVLTGPEFVPLRDGLPAWSPNQSERIGVSLGGGALPEALASALRMVGERIGTANLVASGAWVPASWEQVAAGRLWESVAHCDRMLVAGGVSALEAAAVGVPVVVIGHADNQLATLAWARANGVPTVDVPRFRDEAELVRAIEVAIPNAVPLPPLTDGSMRVARHLAELARRIAV